MPPDSLTTMWLLLPQRNEHAPMRVRRVADLLSNRGDPGEVRSGRCGAVGPGLASAGPC
jgi:hypothetical protein